MTSVPLRQGDRIRLTTPILVDGEPVDEAEGVVRVEYGTDTFLVMLDQPTGPYWKLIGAPYGDAWIVVTPGGDDEHTTHNEWPDEGPTEGEPF